MDKLIIHQFLSPSDEENSANPGLLATVGNECPQCRRGYHSLVILSRKDKLRSKDNVITSTMKLTCVCCKWTTIKDFKWKWNVQK